MRHVTARLLIASVAVCTAACGVHESSVALALSAVGCADGQREGFTDLAMYPDIAGCSGAWTIPGIHTDAPGTAPA